MGQCIENDRKSYYTPILTGSSWLIVTRYTLLVVLESSDMCLHA